MKESTVNSNHLIMVMYALIAIGVTMISAQDRIQAQDSDQEKAASTKKESASKKEATGKPLDNGSIGKIDDPRKPVVRVKTNHDSDSELVYQSDSIEIVIPEWYAKLESTEENESPADQVCFRVMGFDEEQLQTEISSNLQSEIDRYVDELLGTNAHVHVSFSESEKRATVRKDEIRHGIYFNGSGREPVDFYFAHVEFDDRFRELAKTKWVQKRQESRLVQFGLLAGAALLLVGFVFGGLKLNSATSGFYQGRLQFFVAIVILGVIAAGIYFGTWIDWI